MSKRAFVLMEAIIVIAVLCVVLITLYAGYSSVLVGVQKKSLYDNTEYIYRTSVVRDYFENNGLTVSKAFDIYCSNILSSREGSSTIKSCYNKLRDDGYENTLFKNLEVEAVYFSLWDTTKIELSGIEATTQNYIKVLDPPIIQDTNVFRIIVMYKSMNDEGEREVYQYATLRYGSRG